MASVHFERVEGVATLVIADQESGDVVEIQRADQFDDQDRSLGMDTYCVVRDGRTAYGGITAWDIDSGTLAVHLSGVAQEALDLPSTLAIPIDDDGAALLVAVLPELLA